MANQKRFNLKACQYAAIRKAIRMRAIAAKYAVCCEVFAHAGTMLPAGHLMYKDQQELY